MGVYRMGIFFGQISNTEIDTEKCQRIFPIHPQELCPTYPQKGITEKSRNNKVKLLKVEVIHITHLSTTTTSFIYKYIT